MLDTHSPPREDETKIRAVSPPPPAVNSHYASRSSTPGVSALDGTPLWIGPSLYPPPPRPPAPSPPSPPPEIAIWPATLPDDAPQTNPDNLEMMKEQRAPPRPAQHRSQPPDPLFSPSSSSSSSPPSSAAANPSPSSQVPTSGLARAREQVAPLSEIRRLLRLRRSHEHRCAQVEKNLHSLQIAAARTARLAHTARSVQRTLAECIRGEDKPSFVNLLHAFYDAGDDCLQPTMTGDADLQAGPLTDPVPSGSFLTELSPSSRTSIVDFLAKVRYDGEFIADRLGSLTHKELLALLPDRSNARASDSILGGSTRLSSRVSKPLGFVVDAQVDLLSSSAYSSPLEALILSVHTVTDAGSSDERRATRVWATACASLIVGQKPGSERLVPAVLDMWTDLRPWPGKERLEIWILQTLQSGSFLLEHSTKQTFRARMEGRSDISVEDERRAEAFYCHRVHSLLELLGDSTGASVLPPAALDMCHAMWDKLGGSPGHQRALPQFLITRWLFSTFIFDLITLPEAHGLLTDHYISDPSRQRLLREIAGRAQKAVFDVAYSWKHGSAISSNLTRLVQSVMSRLEGTSSSNAASHPSAVPNRADGQGDHDEAFLVVSAKDVAMSLHALYPQRRPASVASDSDNNIRPGLQSSASSISGFSLFSHAKAQDLSMEMVGSSSPDFHHRHTPDPSAARLVNEMDEPSSDLNHMREACLELEDLVTNQASQSRDLWGVLYVPPGSAPLRTLREEFLQLGISHQDFRKLNGSLCDMSSIKSLPREYSSCARAVEILLLENDEAGSPILRSSSFLEDLSHTGQVLDGLFEQCIQECKARSDFVTAHWWFCQLQEFHFRVLGSADMDVLAHILAGIHSTARSSIDRAVVQKNACESWSGVLHSRWQLRNKYLDPAMRELEKLRDKMWYVADVRTSAPYDEARSIAAALRIMGKPKRLQRTRLAPPLRHWSGPKVASTNLHLKTEAQILEILSARPDHGGPNKLSDEQSRALELWMDRQNIDNLCKGEERLHKLCMEVRKCVDLITATAPADSSLLSNNLLFTRDAAFREHEVAPRQSGLLSSLYGNAGGPNLLSLQTHVRSNGALSTTSRTLSSVSSQDYLETHSPPLTNKSSVPFWSPAMTEVESPSSATSVGSTRTQSALRSSPQKLVNGVVTGKKPSPLDQLRQRATALVLSDLTTVLFNDGSETDCAFWSGLGWELIDKHLRGIQALQDGVGSRTPRSVIARPPALQFGFESAFATILAKFSATSNPSTKLSCLYDIDRLLVPYTSEQTALDSRIGSFVRSASDFGQATPPQRQADSTETSITGFRSIFAKSSLRPKTIFRDLQYIAALLPASVLHNTPEGKAFCNAAVAISGLKQEARSVMVETADSIVAYHSNNRGHGRSSSTAQQQRDSATFTTPSRTPSAEEVARYSMADAGHLLQITAKEGDPVAQRELATLYLTNPELMERIIAPFARPKDVFKEELEGKWRRNQDPNRCDPTTMCVAHHWMSLSSKGGDSLAKEYLRQREEMDSF